LPTWDGQNLLLPIDGDSRSNCSGSAGGRDNVGNDKLNNRCVTMQTLKTTAWIRRLQPGSDMNNTGELMKETIGTLFRRAALHCSNPDCGILTSAATIKDNGAVNIGEAAHIYGRTELSKRYNPEMTAAKRRANHGLAAPTARLRFSLTPSSKISCVAPGLPCRHGLRFRRRRR